MKNPINLLRGLTQSEELKWQEAYGLILARAEEKTNLKALRTGIYRDLQAQKIPPNVTMSTRRHPVDYLLQARLVLGSWPDAFLSYLSPSTWTSSGGSFKLAEERLGYDLVNILLEKEKKQGQSSILEVGAGYAGFKSQPAQGMCKLSHVANDKMGNTINAYFTNLSRWHEQLPNGVEEFPGVTASTLDCLSGRISPLDIIYSQWGAFYDPLIDRFIPSASGLLKSDGLLIFNHSTFYEGEILNEAKKNLLSLEKKVELHPGNNIYAFRKA
ncbi:MAG: hypothetical protein WCV90_06380 [Candidatus Woesearchaeota archaeon]|jgi:hypothetical protein